MDLAEVERYTDAVKSLLPLATGAAVGGVLFVLIKSYLSGQDVKAPPRVKLPPKKYIDDEGVEREMYHDPETDSWYTGADVAKPQAYRDDTGQSPHGADDTESRIDVAKDLRAQYDDWLAGTPYTDINGKTWSKTYRKDGNPWSFDEWYSVIYLGVVPPE
jgi:hypothetical protein